MCYPLPDRGIIYFPLEYMRLVAQISDAQAGELELVSTRNPEYPYPPAEVYARLGVALQENSWLPKQRELC